MVSKVLYWVKKKIRKKAAGYDYRFDDDNPFLIL